jgi:molybdopterin-guanine dinucleotide biosynthesis protein A
MAVEAAANALGLGDKTVDAVKQALSGVTPEQMLALKTADQTFALQMQALGFKQVADMEAIAAGDRDSARRMQTAKPSPVPALLTCFVVGAFTATLVLLLKFDVPATNRDIVVYMIGQLSGGFTSALAFWLGTTRDSGRKTELLAQSSPAQS